MSTALTASSLRERQRDLTRQLIIEALARVIVEIGIHQFSMQQVADEAGVSLRTLYRQFATRDELLEGFGDEVHRIVGAEWPSLPDGMLTSDDVVDAIMRICHAMADRPYMFRAWAITHMATGGLAGSRRDRTERIQVVVRALLPHHSPADQARVFAVFRVLAGSLAWKVMIDDLGLDVEDAAEATGWALRTLFRDLESGGRPTSRP